MNIATGGQWPDAVAALLRDLPEWFGIEESVNGYVEAARSLPTVAASVGDQIVGVCLLRHHTPVADVKLLEVKTFGASGHSEEYTRTRAFYESLGFLPLEERTDIWGPDNPCLISVKPLV